MAIIKCSECGHDVSDKATNCPHCGYSVTAIKADYGRRERSKEVTYYHSNSGDVAYKVGQSENKARRRVNPVVGFFVALAIIIGIILLANSNGVLTSDYFILNNGENLDMKIGGSQTVSITSDKEKTYDEYYWESSDTGIAKVDANGKVTGVEQGTVTITVTADDDVTGSCRITVTPKVRYCKNGKVLLRPSGECIAPVKVKAPADNDCYIFFKCINRAEQDFAFYVKANKSAQMDVPVGKYEMYYASGDTWYGTKYKFGEDTIYSKADDIFKFYIEGDQVIGTVVTLSRVTNGNLQTQEIDEVQFP